MSNKANVKKYADPLKVRILDYLAKRPDETSREIWYACGTNSKSSRNNVVNALHELWRDKKVFRHGNKVDGYTYNPTTIASVANALHPRDAVWVHTSSKGTTLKAEVADQGIVSQSWKTLKEEPVDKRFEQYWLSRGFMAAANNAGSLIGASPELCVSVLKDLMHIAFEVGALGETDGV